MSTIEGPLTYTFCGTLGVMIVALRVIAILGFVGFSILNVVLWWRIRVG